MMTASKDNKSGLNSANLMTPSTATHQTELLKTIYTKRSLSEIQTQLPKPRFEPSQSVNHANLTKISYETVSGRKTQLGTATAAKNDSKDVNIESNDYVSGSKNHGL